VLAYRPTGNNTMYRDVFIEKLRDEGLQLELADLNESQVRTHNLSDWEKSSR
jgi:hypothetical protein